MNILEILGVAFLFLIFFSTISVFNKCLKNKKKSKNNPELYKKNEYFNLMKHAHERLYEITQLDIKGIHENNPKFVLDDNYEEVPQSENIREIQHSINILLEYTKPMTDKVYASDYYSKYIDYTVILYLANYIIELEKKNIDCPTIGEYIEGKYASKH